MAKIYKKTVEIKGFKGQLRTRQTVTICFSFCDVILFMLMLWRHFCYCSIALQQRISLLFTLQWVDEHGLLGIITWLLFLIKELVFEIISPHAFFLMRWWTDISAFFLKPLSLDIPRFDKFGVPVFWHFFYRYQPGFSQKLLNIETWNLTHIHELLCNSLMKLKPSGSPKPGLLQREVHSVNPSRASAVVGISHIIHGTDSS